jgi:hypothetical protein
MSLAERVEAIEAGDAIGEPDLNLVFVAIVLVCGAREYFFFLS